MSVASSAHYGEMFPSDDVVLEAPVIHVGDIPLQPLSEKGTTTALSSSVLEGNVTIRMPPPKPGVFFFILLILAAAWTLAGAAFFGLCFFHYKHYQAAIWALASGIFSGGVLHLQILHLAKRLDLWHDVHTLGGLKVLGVIVFTTSLVSSATYWAFVITRHEGFSMAPGKLYPAAILSTITLVWGLLLYGSARHCQKRIAEAHPGLLAYGGFGAPDA
uniref:Putative conserved plasma membrane protein n=1 Tax=Amblyomma aureolatum TaxID=187763 RepID=A0A1E1XI60_9ACAR